MRAIIQRVPMADPEVVAGQLGLTRTPGLVLLRSRHFESPQARYSFLAADPFLTFESTGSRCRWHTRSGQAEHFGNPWNILDQLVARYELLDEIDVPFPLGGCLGFWGYDLRHFIEPRLPSSAVADLSLPDCHVGFYSSLMVFDHHLNEAWIVSTGLESSGERNESRAIAETDLWKGRLESTATLATPSQPPRPIPTTTASVKSSMSRPEFEAAVRTAQEWIRLGHIYQVNLAQRLTAPWTTDPWSFHLRLAQISPAPFSAFMDTGRFAISSASPELFLRMSGHHVRTRPIKGTRPRDPDQTRDAQLTYELQTSPKEMAELVMITDLLRNDLGRVCEFGSIQVPELARLERYSHVQHLVSTVEGTLRSEITHFAALASCFPGGSITGAPKIRAMEIIDTLEPVSRGPYTGAIGYMGFNRESQFSIAIRTAILTPGAVHYHAGAGIVADSIASQEYDETMAKARGFLEVIGTPAQQPTPPRPTLHPSGGTT